MYKRVKRYSLALAISAVVFWSFVPQRLPSLYTLRPVNEAVAQGGQLNPMNIMMMIMMLMMMMSLARNNDLQGKQGERMNDAAPRLLTDPYGGGGLGVLPVNPQQPINPQPVNPRPVNPQPVNPQPGININIPLS